MKNIPRIFCVGRNYAMHVKELNNEMPLEPVIFIKPFSSLVTANLEIPYPKHGNILHHEVEIVVQIGKTITSPQTTVEACEAISGLGIGLDLTLRDIQDQLKKQGLPWEKAKSFDNSATLGKIISFNKEISLANITFSCYVNNELRQKGNTADMFFSIPSLIIHIAKIWKLIPGDLIYTGTPEGVGVLNRGDKIRVHGELFTDTSWDII